MLAPLDWMEMAERQAGTAAAALEGGKVASAYTLYRLAARAALLGIAALDGASPVARGRFFFDLQLLGAMMDLTGRAVVVMTVLFEASPAWTRMDRATRDLVLLRDRPLETMPEGSLL